MPSGDFSRPELSGSDEWTVWRREFSAAFEVPREFPALGETGWRPLGRHQRAGEPATRGFNPGWARMTWEPAALVVDFCFVATAACNAARRLNERTHLLGDVGEIFLQRAESDRYLEVHVTPENQRLQLEWNSERFEAVRTKRAALEDFAIADPNWVQTCTAVASTGWSASVRIPAAVLLDGGEVFLVGARFLAAVCRYDYGGGDRPVLSSTANFGGQPFHTRSAWHHARLSK